MEFEIEIRDIYDFTDFKNLKEYGDSEKSNFGVVSSEYGVIKTFEVKIKFQLNPYTV